MRACLVASGVLTAPLFCEFAVRASEPLRIATFEADVTPPLGSPLCDGLVPPASRIDDPLSARGIVLFAEGSPIVLCAVDWVGIGNGGHDEFRAALAEAAGTTAERVALHALHQHDAPGCDFTAEEILAAEGLGRACFDPPFLRSAIRRTAEAVRGAMAEPRAVTHVGFGRAKVEQVASNRRILGPDGKVRIVRFSSSRNPEAIEAPEGVIDPYVRLISFWDGDRPLVSMTYYATHPQSYYGQGGVSADFVGMARSQRGTALPDVRHIHFNGAGGNVGAGKYNDGSPERRPVLAERLADGMRAAWESTRKFPISTADVEWRTRDVVLPLRDIFLEDEPHLAKLRNSEVPLRERCRAARDLAYAARVKAGQPIQIACLRLGPAYVLHMPGELFVEYQLAAQEMRPEEPVCMAAYGDYGPGYIGTKIAYSQGGYETSFVSRTAPEVEGVLMEAMRELLK